MNRGSWPEDSPARPRAAAAPDAPAPPSEVRGVADYLWVVHRHRWTAAAVFVAVAGWGTYGSLTETPVYASTPAVLEVVSDVGGVATLSDVLDRQVVSSQHFETQMALIRSERVLRAAYDASPAVAARMPYASFAAGVTTAPVRNSFLVHVRFESPHAALNDDAANAVAESFITTVRGIREERNSSAAAEFERRSAAAHERLARADEALAEFRRRVGLADLRAEKSKLDEQVAALEGRLDEKAIALGEAERRWTEARAAEDQGQPAALPDVIADLRFAAVDAELVGRERALREAEKRADAGNRELEALRAEVDSLRRQREEIVAAVHGRIRRARDAALEEKAKIAELVAGRRAEQSRLGGLLVEQLALEDARERCRAAVEEVSRRATEVQGATGFDLSPAVLWERARETTSPIRPRHGRDIASAAVLALFLAAVVVLLAEQFDDAVIHPEAARRATGLPVLGMLPRIEPPGVADLASHRDPHCGMAEAVRIIRTGLLFSPDGGHERRVILVTSAEMGEGKTLTSTNLAIAFAQAGHRTLLIDGDLRNPRVHRVFDLANDSGLSDIFAGDGIDAPAFEVPGAEGRLLVTPSGPRPPNPAELLGGERLARWIAATAQRFDRVIIDSPPAGPVSDPALLSRVADGVILVLELGRTSQRALRRAYEHLSKVGAPVLGIVLNGVRMNPRGYYYYYGRYGYAPGRPETPAEVRP